MEWHSKKIVMNVWRRFTAPPTKKEVTFILTFETLVTAKSEARKRLMSPYVVTQSRVDKLLLLSINALIAVAGFCGAFARLCQDKLVIQLQAVSLRVKLPHVIHFVMLCFVI